jgi:hypothetical protein
MRRSFVVAVAFTLALPLSAATEPNPSKDQRQSIEKLLVAMRADETARSMMDAIFKQMEKQILENATANGSSEDNIAEAKEIFASFRERAAKIDLGGELNEAYIRMYAKYFTVDEVDAMTAFYTSPVGQKSLDVMPRMMEEAMQTGVTHLGPKIEQAMKEAVEESEKKRPWRRTMRELTDVAAAIEAYAIDNDETYPSGDYASLKNVLVPDYLEALPEKDIWNHEYAYVASTDGQHYRLVSAGADTIFDWDSRRITASKDGHEATLVYRDRLEDDVIYADGQWVQLPVQAKPKGE